MKFAYVFWHARSEAVSQETYENDLLAFYQAIGQADCPGVGRTVVSRISSLPWAREQNGYEDWTFIEGTRVLEELNMRAVSGSTEAAHTSIAQHMDYGCGGLYYHVWGDFELHLADRAQWLVRPRGIQFRPVIEQIAKSAGTPVSVWRRFMVLGPGTEFIVFGPAPLALQLPSGWQSHTVDRGSVVTAGVSGLEQTSR